MALSATVIGAALDTNTSSAWSLTTTANAPAGQPIIVTVGNHANRAVNSVGDSVGNTYVELIDTATGGSAIWWCANPLALALGGTIDVVLSGNSADKTISAVSLSAAATYVTSSAAGAVGTGTAPSVTTGAIIAAGGIAVGDLATVGIETITQASGWTDILAAQNRHISGYIQVASAATKTYDPASTDASWRVSIAGFDEVVAGGGKPAHSMHYQRQWGAA